MNETGNNYQEEVLDLGEILAILRKRYLVIVIITLAALVTSGVLSFFVLTPVYEARAVLLVTQTALSDPKASSQDKAGLEGMMDSITRLPEMTINTYVGQLESQAVLEQVLKKLKLNQDGYTVEKLAECISVAAIKDTNLIEVKVTNSDPYLASKIANTLNQEFLAFMSATNEQQMGKSVEFLKKQVGSTEAELKKAVANLNRLESLPRSVASLEQMITEKSKDLSGYQTELMQKNMEYQQLIAGRNQAVNQLQTTPPTVTVSKDTSDGVAAFQETNPVYSELKSQINTKTIDAVEAQTAISNLKGMVSRLSDETKTLQGELGRTKSTLDLAQKEVERLQSTDSLLRSKIDETQMGRSLKFGETSLVAVSPAMVPNRPVSPKKALNMGIGLTLGLIMSVGLAFLLHFLDNTLKTPREVEEHLGLPVLGQIPFYNVDKIKPGGGTAWNRAK